MTDSFQLFPIGCIHNTAESVFIRIDPKYRDALLGLEQYSHILALYWFDRHDTPEQRGIMQVHPRKNPNNPLTGVFATHAPVRPNLIAVCYCKLLRIDGNTLYLDEIDAFDQTPVIDIKPYIPLTQLAAAEIRVPAWV